MAGAGWDVDRGGPQCNVAVCGGGVGYGDAGSLGENLAETT